MLSGIILLQNLRWIVPTTFMLGAAPAYLSVWAAWRTLSCLLPQWVYVKGDDFLFSTYHRNLLFFFETIAGVEELGGSKFRLAQVFCSAGRTLLGVDVSDSQSWWQLIFYGDLEAIEARDKGENVIYMSNHQCTVDWVLGSCLSLRRGSLGCTRYVLKDGLKFLPFYGFYLGMHGSLFVKRAGKFRKEKAVQQLEKDAKNKKPMWMVVFPEGTRFNPDLQEVIEGSKQFARDQGLEPLENVLFPRARAFQVCVEQLKEALDSVYDVTVGYENTYNFDQHQRLPSPTMQDFLMGASPKVHVHVRKIPIKEVPSSEKEVKAWLYKQYQAKDRLLKEFYSAKSPQAVRFPGESKKKPLSLQALLPSMLLWCGGFATANAFRESRDLYWKVGSSLAGAGLLWMALRH